MPQKGRFTVEEKVRLVEAYLTGEKSQGAIGREYKIERRTLKGWVQQYKLYGTVGLRGTAINRKYSPALKRQVVEEYLWGPASLRELCAKYDISGKSLLRSWIKCYNGHRDFRQSNNGGEIYVIKGRDTTLEERIEIVSHCIASNKDYGLTIEKYSVSYQQIYGWIRRYEKDGPDGLVDHRGKRKDEASMTEVEKLRAQLRLKDAENLRLQMENDLLKKLAVLERG